MTAYMTVCPYLPNPEPELQSSRPNQGANLETASTEARSREADLVVGAGKLGMGNMAIDTMHERHWPQSDSLNRKLHKLIFMDHENPVWWPVVVNILKNGRIAESPFSGEAGEI